MTIPTDGRIDLDALAELAKAATSGPWGGSHFLVRADDRTIVVHTGIVGNPLAHARQDEANAAYIRALDPQTVLTLIDLARRAAIPSEQGEAVAWIDAELESGRWPEAGDMMRFLGENGYDHEQKAARERFIVGAVYEVVDCQVGDWWHSIRFKGIEGGWNGVMFRRVVATHPAPAAGVKVREREGAIVAMAIELEKSGLFDLVKSHVWATRLYEAALDQGEPK